MSRRYHVIDSSSGAIVLEFNQGAIAVIIIAFVLGTLIF